MFVIMSCPRCLCSSQWAFLVHAVEYGGGDIAAERAAHRSAVAEATMTAGKTHMHVFACLHRHHRLVVRMFIVHSQVSSFASPSRCGSCGVGAQPRDPSLGPNSTREISSPPYPIPLSFPHSRNQPRPSSRHCGL